MQHRKHLHVLVADLGADIQAVSRELPDGTLALLISERVLVGDPAAREGAHELFVEIFRDAA